MVGMWKVRDDMKELIMLMCSYRNNYYEWLALKEKTGVKSPGYEQRFSGYSDKSKSLLNDIQRKEELETEMKKVEDTIKLLYKNDNKEYYRVIYLKYIKFMRLEDIASMIHVSNATVYRTYDRAKKELLKAVKLDSKC